jgi:DNA-binding NarL/FixJ family response regulator
MIICLRSNDIMRCTRLSSAWKKAGHQVTSKAEDAPPNLIVIDLSYPGSLDLIGQKLKSYPNVKIIAFGPHTDGEALKNAAKAGADKVVSQGKVVEYVLGLTQAQIS